MVRCTKAGSYAGARRGIARRRPVGQPRGRCVEGAEPGDVAHLAALSRLRLAVEMEVRGRVGDQRRPVLDIGADQVLHGGVGAPCRGAERQAADGADVLRELAGGAALDGPMTRIVDARRDLVDQQPAVPGDEELDAEHADMIERPDGALRTLPRRRRESRRDGGRRQRHIEDAVRMAVLDRVEARHRAARRPRDDRRDLALDGRDRFEDRRTTAERAPARRRQGRRPH